MRHILIFCDFGSCAPFPRRGPQTSDTAWLTERTEFPARLRTYPQEYLLGEGKFCGLPEFQFAFGVWDPPRSKIFFTVSVGGAIATVSFLRQSFTEFKAETAAAFRELWKKEGEQDARLNTVERKHEGFEREHNLLTREHRVHHGGTNLHFKERKY